MVLTAEQGNEVWNSAPLHTRRLMSRRVDRGWALLDRKLGKVWPWHINLDHFDLGNDCACVLGQLAVDIVPKRRWMTGTYARFQPRYHHALNALAMTSRKAQTHGFLGEDGLGITHELLTECWRRRIAAKVGRQRFRGA